MRLMFVFCNHNISYYLQINITCTFLICAPLDYLRVANVRNDDRDYEGHWDQISKYYVCLQTYKVYVVSLITIICIIYLLVISIKIKLYARKYARKPLKLICTTYSLNSLDLVARTLNSNRQIGPLNSISKLIQPALCML